MPSSVIRRAGLFVILGLILSVGFIGLFLYRSMGTSEGNVRRVFFADNISWVHQLLIDRFNAAHRGSIEVVPVDLPFDKFSTNERKELLARSLRNKSDRIDIFAVDLIWVPRFSRWSEPLAGYFSPEERRGFLDEALESCSYDSLLVAAPLYIDVGMMYYRRDLLHQLPDAAQWEAKLQNSITWEEFFELRRLLKCERKPYYLFQGEAFEGLVCNYLELIAGLEGHVSRHRTIDLQSPAAREALQMMVDFVYKTKVSPPVVAECDERRSYTYMLDHDAMFVRGWPNFVESFRRTYADTVKLNAIGRAALPHFTGRRPVSVFGGWNLMISKNSPNKEAALQFIRFLLSVETQKTLFEAGGYIPVNKSVFDDELFMAQHPDLAFYRRLLAHGFHRPALEEYTRISDVISHFVNLALKREVPVREALKRASRILRYDEILIK
jgi:multiple sugar transport system substrate-binding protein